MPVTIEGIFIVALRKDFSLPNESELEKNFGWEKQKFNKRLLYLIKNQFGLDKCDFPYFRYTDGINYFTKDILEEQEIFYKDLLEDFYIVYGSVSYMDSSHSWYQPTDVHPYLKDKFYQAIFAGKTVIMERKSLVTDTLILLLAMID